jgi:nicotinamidase-related amidase
MTTLPGRENTALLVIDMQNGVVDGGYNREGVIANIRDLVERARGAGIPVIWVQHTDEDLPVGSEAWDYVSELTRDVASEALVQKEYGDAFEDTELEELLSAAGVGQLIVTGAQTDVCVRSTLHGAITRGYDATLVRDAHTTVDLSAQGAPPPEQVIAHTNLYWGYHTAPGRTGAAVDTADVQF